MNSALFVDTVTAAAGPLTDRTPVKFSGSSSRLQTQVGVRNGDAICSTGKAGALVFGPYIAALPGNYRANFRGTSPSGRTSGVTVDVVSNLGRTVHARTNFPEAGSESAAIAFEITYPGVTDLEFRVFASEDTDFRFESVEIACTTDARASSYKAGDFRAWSTQVCPENGAAIIVPTSSWLPFSVALARFIHADRGLKSILVPIAPLDWQCRADILSGPIHAVLTVDELLGVSDDLIEAIVVHDFGWTEQTTTLNRRFPRTPIWIYSDGFRGELCDPPRLDVAAAHYFVFGDAPRHSTMYRQSVVPLSLVRDAYCSLAAHKVRSGIRQIPKQPDDIAVVYLRYWGSGVYAFSPTDIAHALVGTVERCVPAGVPVVVKTDPRVRFEVTDACMTALARHRNLIECGIFLEVNGGDRDDARLEAPYLFSHGWLISARYHIVLDSSVGFHVAAFAGESSAVNIVFGCISPEWDRFPGLVQGSRVIDFILRTDAGDYSASRACGAAVVRHYAEAYAKRVSDHLRYRFASVEQSAHTAGCFEVQAWQHSHAKGSIHESDPAIDRAICRTAVDVARARNSYEFSHMISRGGDDAELFVLLNETPSIDGHLHAGSNAVTRYLIEKIQSTGRRLIGCANDGARASSLLSHPLIERVGLVVFNGEGSLHHDAARCVELMQFCAEMKRRGARVVLMNTIFYSNSETTGQYLSIFDYVSVRDRGSSAQISKYRNDYHVVPDLSFAAFSIDGEQRHDSSGDAQPKGVVIDCVLGNSSQALHRYARSNGLPYYLMGELNLRQIDQPNGCFRTEAGLFPKLLGGPIDLAGAGYCVTGRFHGAIAALVAGVPTMVVPSNTPKIEFLADTLGLSRQMLLPTNWLALDHREQVLWVEERAAAWDESAVAAVRAEIKRARDAIECSFFDVLGSTASAKSPSPSS